MALCKNCWDRATLIAELKGVPVIEVYNDLIKLTCQGEPACFVSIACSELASSINPAPPDSSEPEMESWESRT